MPKAKAPIKPVAPVKAAAAKNKFLDSDDDDDDDLFTA